MISKYPIYRLINGEDVITKAEVIDGVVFLHNPMLIDIVITDNGKIQVILSPYIMYARVIKVFQSQHILIATEAPSEIIKIYKNTILKCEQINKSEDNVEPEPDFDKRVLH